MKLGVNGRVHDVTPAPVESLVETLREHLHLTGTKVACGRGECGACTVLLDGKPVYACLTLTAACEGVAVRTIEGIGGPGGLHAVQRAFIEADAVQCGFCTPGQVISVVALLERDPDPDDEAIQRALSGNLCRCGTYPRIVAAVRAAAAAGRSAR
jgi:aerobic-type carbon monoxide dehydrogenase small subunit (CoxS/CutS family)